ncbi:hypothetical protein WR25_07207 [Diploscapter pachys]|uniref:Uncharacterized protein n=1 Tax=Diploscapter pachys TaxID=2018661 RepID=A0A2A2M205_9BILA|nr:hypothetical protein WR25_07207 [Diploscapter pachys]
MLWTFIGRAGTRVNAARGLASALWSYQCCMRPCFAVVHGGAAAFTGGIGSDVSFEPILVIQAGRGIVVLRNQVLEAGGEGGLVGRAIVILQRAAHPFLGRRLVVIVARVIALPIRRRLIQPRGGVATVQPSAHQRRVPRFH